MAAGRVRELSLLITVFLRLIFHSNNQLLTSGFYFEKIRGSDDDVIESSTAFHQCSLDGNCIYVGKISKDANLKRISDTSNLGSFHAVWKKVEQPGNSDCKQALEHGVSTSGIVKLRISASLVKQGYCDMVTSGGGWTVFQRRVDNAVNFNRSWESYKKGFGNLSGSFWLGLDAVHQLTTFGNTVLRIELKKDDGSTGYAEYTDFKILSEAEKYKLEFYTYSGTIGNGLKSNENMKFSTYDNDNDIASWNCAIEWRGAWWHRACFEANLNNDYYNSSEIVAYMANTMSWKTAWTDWSFGKIIYSEMKVKKTAYSDCKLALKHGVATSGLIKLRISASLVKQVYCDMVTSGGGWTVFQRRVNNTVNFNRNWKSYKEGFGDLFGNFWLGLEALHQLTEFGSTTLRIELKKDDSSTGYAEFYDFRILSEAEKYKLEYNSYIGTIGDAMLRSQNMKFSTYDNDNDVASWNCAYSWRGGWWHSQCFDANLNNDYYNSSETEAEMANTMSWRSSWTDLKYGKITFSEMKLRRI